MLGNVAKTVGQTLLKNYCETRDEDDPNRRAAEHALRAWKAYEELKLDVAVEEITKAVLIVNTEHGVDERLKKAVLNAHSFMREGTKSIASRKPLELKVHRLEKELE